MEIERARECRWYESGRRCRLIHEECHGYTCDCEQAEDLDDCDPQLEDSDY